MEHQLLGFQLMIIDQEQWDRSSPSESAGERFGHCNTAACGSWSTSPLCAGEPDGVSANNKSS